jgi:hypothetical protein
MYILVAFEGMLLRLLRPSYRHSLKPGTPATSHTVSADVHLGLEGEEILPYG